MGELLYLLRCWVTDRNIPSGALENAVIAWVDGERPREGDHAQALYDSLVGCDTLLKTASAERERGGAQGEG